MKILYKSIFLATLLLMIGCDDSFENDVTKVELNNGKADFSKFVSIGNSLTSGFADGTLYNSAQKQSFPAIIAGQMAVDFNQPLMPDDIGGFKDLGMNGKLTLQLVNGKPLPVPSESQTTFSNSFVSGKFNNMGVPGAKSFHLLANGYGNPAGLAQGAANPFFVRFASSANASVMEDVMAQKPTFFTLWIGNNDVLSYASSGGAGVNQKGNMNPASYGGNDLSDPTLVGGILKNILDGLVTNGGAKGAIANIPYVTSIPFFTTVPAKPLSPLNESYSQQLPMLNQFYGQLNQVFDALNASDRKIVFDDKGASGVVFVDDNLTNLSEQIKSVLIQAGQPEPQAQLMGIIFGQVRQSKKGDLIPLTMSSKIGQFSVERIQQLMQMGVPEAQAKMLSVMGLTYPLDEMVLSANEVSEVIKATNDINKSIEALAKTYKLAFVDMNYKMKELESGLMFDGVTYNATFVSGGAFSLDGVHLTSRGYAVIANYFMEAINSTYQSNLAMVNPNNYTGVQFP